MRIIYLLIAVMISQQSFAAKLIEPKVRNVQLKETTTMTLPIIPDSGTRLVFPFKLDNPDLNPQLKIKLTNNTGFDVPDSKEELAQLTDQNTMTITGVRHPVDQRTGKPPVFLGTLYISIGGYNLTINLRTSLRPAEQISDVIFSISDADRSHMVEKAIERHTDMLNEDHKKKLKVIDDTAREYALGYVGEMALEEPDSISFKIEEEIKIGSERLTAYIEELITYNDRYYVFLFDIENDTTKDFAVSSWQLSGSDKKQASDTVIQGHFSCSKTIKSDKDYRCSFSTLDSRLAKFNSYKLKVTSDRGEGIVEW